MSEGAWNLCQLRILPVILPGGQRAKESNVPGFLQGTDDPFLLLRIDFNEEIGAWCTVPQRLILEFP